MKKQIINFTLFLILAFTVSVSCSKKDDEDTTPPSVLSVVSVTPTNGGGIISYTLPSIGSFIRTFHILPST